MSREVVHRAAMAMAERIQEKYDRDPELTYADLDDIVSEVVREMQAEGVLVIRDNAGDAA